MATRLSVWVGLCYLLAFALRIGQIGLVLYGLMVLSSSFGEITVWAFGFGFALALSSIFFASRTLQSKIEQIVKRQSKTASLKPRLEYTKRIVADLCAIRGMPIPIVIFETQQKSPVQRLLAGMLDRVLGIDVLVMHEDFTGFLTEKQLRCVLAHELRHCNAVENKLQLMVRVAKIAFWNCILIGCAVISLGTALGTDPERYSALLPLPGFLWFMTYVGAHMIMQNLSSQFVEFKTDALSCKDSGDHEGLISALNSLFRVAGLQGTLLDRQESLLFLPLRTHPTNAARARALRWCFGHAAKTAQVKSAG